MVGAIIGGIIAFIVTAALTAEGAHFPQGQWTAALIAAVWVAVPLVKHGQIERYNLLRPVPKRYQVPWPQAFAKIREILARATYKIGNRWNVTTADTQSKHIHAIVQFTEEEFAGFDGTSVENIRRKTEHVRRLVEVDIQFKEADDACIVQLDFRVQTEGGNYAAADFIVHDLKEAVDRELGAGTPIGGPAEFTMEAPPWWLLIGTGFFLLSLWGEASQAVFGK